MESLLGIEKQYTSCEKAGIRDWISNNFYDLSVFNSSLTKNLTGLTIYHSDEYISAIELFYDNFSTGLFKGREKNTNLKIYSIYIEIKENEYIEYIYGNYNVDYITSLNFKLSSGVLKGFNNMALKDKTDIKYFLFNKKNNEIFALNFAFGTFMTFISPIFREFNKLTLEQIKENEYESFTTQQSGKKYDDSKVFNYSNELYKFGRITKICFFHDNSFIKGIKIFYGNKEILFYHNISVKGIKSETLIIDSTDEINFLSVRSGDMIDNITIFTNKGKSISAGGYGGGQVIYNMQGIKKEMSKDNIKFCGFSGGFFNNLHYLKLIFTE